MFDHVGLKVSNLPASIAFYTETLAPLGIQLISSGDGYAGFGPPGAAGLWLYAHEGTVPVGAHIAFRAANRNAVQQFHARGLAAKGRNNGAPAVRPDCSADYYGASLIDPDVNNIEAVCFN